MGFLLNRGNKKKGKKKKKKKKEEEEVKVGTHWLEAVS